MSSFFKCLIGFCFLFTLGVSTNAQFRGSNLAEFQYGNIPDTEPQYQGSLYNQLNLSYRYKKLSVSSRMELYSAPFGNSNDYARISQYKLSYKNKWVSLDAGHIYSSLGRGLLMRNYEIPSSIFESLGYRARYGFYKDMHGFSAKFKSKYINVKLLRGNTLTVDLPPTLDYDERRTDLVGGGEIDGSYKNQTLGLIYMRHLNGGNKSNYASVYYNGNIKNFNLYGELAKRVDSVESISSFSDNEAYGGYLGLNYSINALGISLEYKKYQNFLIGNGVNDPPTLVKEHSSKLLNRNTHVPLLLNEEGYQAEVFYLFENGNMITLNHAFSKNELATNSFIFREYYADISVYLSERISSKAFIDFSIDPLSNEQERYTGGIELDVEHLKLGSIVDFELQYIKRETNVKSDITNVLVSYTLSKSGKFSASALLELSNDPFLLADGQKSISYPSASATYHFGRKNKLTVFYGKRRGGPACSSGVCYDVLDFEGVEIRFISRF